MKVLSLFLILFAFIFSANISARQINEYNSKNYIYNHQGNRISIKVYVDFSTEKALHYTAPSSQILQKMLHEDEQGSFLAIPIKKKHKSEDEDDDNDEWECPYCGTINSADQNTCSNRKCPLYRAKGRDW